jgi:argininosuccinate lyase
MAKAKSETTKETPVVNTKDIQEENNSLKNQIEELKAQMALMAQMISTKPETEKSEKKSSKRIRFINLTNGSVVLRGTVMWKIDGQFNHRDFAEKEANIIVENMTNLINSGAVYIADKEFAEEHNLTDIYDTLLDEKSLKELMDKDGKTIIETYKFVNAAQKQIIVDMISTRRENGQFVDANAAIEIGKLCGKDLMLIEPDEDETVKE